MRPVNHVDSSNTAFKLKNAIWAFPYLAVMGLIWGYLADASSGAIIGLVAAVAISVLIGSATPIFNGPRGKSAVSAGRTRASAPAGRNGRSRWSRNARIG